MIYWYKLCIVFFFLRKADRNMTVDKQILEIKDKLVKYEFVNKRI